jgi:hypothetical protein
LSEWKQPPIGLLQFPRNLKAEMAVDIKTNVLKFNGIQATSFDFAKWNMYVIFQQTAGELNSYDD